MGKILRTASRIGVWSVILLTLLAIGFVVNTQPVAAADVIKIGSVADVSGVTSEFGNRFALGLRNYFKYINEKGGINGRKIKFLETDGGYSIPKETAGFKRFAMEGIVVFVHWSTGGHRQIAKMGAEKQIVVFGAGLAEVNVIGAPWAFMHTASYDQVWRGLIAYHIKQNPGKKLKMGILYPDNGWGIMNRDACRAYAKKRGVELVDEEIVAMRELDATTQLLKMKKYNPDFIMGSLNEPVSCVVMRDARKVGIDTRKVQFYVPLQGIGPLALKLCGATVDDLIGGTPYSSWYEKDLPGIKVVRQVFGEDEVLSPWHIHGWAAAMVISEGLRRIGDKKITGENLKKALEGMRNFDTGGITPPITFTPQDHLGSKGVKLFKANIAKNYFEPVGDWVVPK